MSIQVPGKLGDSSEITVIEPHHIFMTENIQQENIMTSWELTDLL